MNIKVIIAMHKPYDVPGIDMYVPIHVGAAGKQSFANPKGSKEAIGDNRGDNISYKNPFYCELTGLYFAWKNMDYDALGLVHYRRHFTCKSKKHIKNYHWTRCVLTEKEAQQLLEKYDIIVPKKRKYYIETLFSHYAHTHDGEHLLMAGEIADKLAPEISPYLERVYSQTSGYMFNMFLMTKSYVDEYCNFIFPILEELEEKVDTSDMNAFDKRYIGRVSEILFNAWVLYKQQAGAKVKSIGCIHTEPEPWKKKIRHFLAAKFLGRKYRKSF